MQSVPQAWMLPARSSVLIAGEQPGLSLGKSAKWLENQTSSLSDIAGGAGDDRPPTIQGPLDGAAQIGGDEDAHMRRERGQRLSGP